MTDRHIFNDHTTLVLRSLKGLVATHPYLSLIPSLKVVYRADHDSKKVSLICGGGSGHEPGTVGFVGKGLLNASVAGDVFASPSARQVGGAIERVGSEKGVILIITNCESHVLAERWMDENERGGEIDRLIQWRLGLQSATTLEGAEGVRGTRVDSEMSRRGF